MAKGSTLEKRFGRNLYESLGARDSQAASSSSNEESQNGAGGDSPPSDQSKPLNEPKTKTTPSALGSSPLDGRSRLREAGLMEIGRIIPDPDQPRKEFDQEAIQQLAASLKSHGQLQPIRVRWSDPLGKWVIISGERRYRAASVAGLTSLQCIFVEDQDNPIQLLTEQLVENCLRKDLTPIEQAYAFQRLSKIAGWTNVQIANELNISPSSVSKTIALLTLPTEHQQQVAEGSLPITAAYELAKVKDPEQQRELAQQAVDKTITRNDLAKAVKAPRATVKEANQGKAPAPIAPPQDSYQEFRCPDGSLVAVSIPKPSAQTDDYIRILSSVIKALSKES